MTYASMMAVAAVAATVLAGLPRVTSAQEGGNYPTRPIRLIAPEVPGSATDVIARTLTTSLSAALGQPVRVDNIFGAPGIAAGVKAPSDGYTLIYGSAGTLALLPHVDKTVTYDPLTDLVPVALFAISPTILAVNPSLPVTNVKELIALLKDKPGQLKMSTAGAGTTGHLAGELFATMAGVKAVAVHYPGGGPAVEGVVSNDSQWTFSPLAGRLPYIRSGKLRALATGADHRLSVLPDVPTVAEAGVPGYVSVGWSGIFVPRGTPQAIVEKLNATIVRLLVSPEVKEQFLQQGAEPATSTPAELGRRLREDFDIMRALAKSAGVSKE